MIWIKPSFLKRILPCGVFYRNSSLHINEHTYIWLYLHCTALNPDLKNILSRECVPLTTTFESVHGLLLGRNPVLERFRKELGDRY